MKYYTLISVIIACASTVQVDAVTSLSVATTQVCVIRAALPARVTLLTGPCVGEALAWGTFVSSLNVTGWHTLDIATNATEPDDALTSYAAGFAEGYLTVESSTFYAGNTGATNVNSKKLQKFLDENLAWIDAQVSADWPINADANYWATVGSVIEQTRGVAAGHAAAGGPLLFGDVYNAIIQGGDIFNLAGVYGVGVDAEAEGRYHKSSAVSGIRSDHCSALIRLLPNNADIIAAHTTWSAFENMLRIVKRYDMALPGASGVPVAGRFVSLSGYPLLQQYSSDDFYLISSGLITLETTIDNNNATLAKEFASTAVVLEWLRNIVANRLARTSSEWATLFSRFASGTYTNSWMILDTNLFIQGKAPVQGTLLVVEEMPGFIRVHDRTDELINDGFWASYNVPSDEFIFNISGQQLLVDEYGGASGAGAYYTFANTSRANIFRRDAPKVIDETSMRALIRYNDYKNDPLSKQACGIDPPYSATNSISDRSDLNIKKGDYLVPDLGHGDSAGIDGKVVLASRLINADRIHGELPFAVISGPTSSASCPSFSWATASFKAQHTGLPETYDSFNWVDVVFSDIAKPWNPVPPCSAPLGVDDPAVPECMCSLPVAQVGNVVVREYGLPANATLVQIHIDDPAFYQVLALGIQEIVAYFQGDNVGERNILGARTTPVTVRNVRDLNYTWIVGMMISTSTFPETSDIPLPHLPVELEQVGQRSMAVVQFNTTSLPVATDFEAACGQLFASKLPKGYTFNMSSSWSPTYVLYSGEVSTFFTNECWAEVRR